MAEKEDVGETFSPSTMNYSGTVLHLQQRLSQAHSLRSHIVCLFVSVSRVRFQLSHFQVTSLCVSIEGTKVRDVTLEGQRHSEIIQAPRKSQLPLCVYVCVCV